MAESTVKLVRGLGQSVENKFAGNAEILREWESASKIETRNVSPKAVFVPVAAV